MAGRVVMQAVGQPRSFRGSLSNALFSAYKRGLSPILHGVSGSMGACRFQPSCSEYAALAISYYGIFRGSWLALRRIAKCHPFHPPQFDPVPVPSHIAHPTLHAAPMQSSLPPVTIEQRAFADRAASSPPAELPDERR